jgi:hypothetical protein
MKRGGYSYEKPNQGVRGREKMLGYTALDIRDIAKLQSWDKCVVMNSYTFWDITTCSPLNINRCFGRKFRLHLQAFDPLHAGSFIVLFFDRRDGGDMFF